MSNFAERKLQERMGIYKIKLYATLIIMFIFFFKGIDKFLITLAEGNFF